MQQPHMQTDFEPIRQVLADYNSFCRIAKNLEWVDISAQYYDWCSRYPLGFEWFVFPFPPDYVKENFPQAFVQAYLSQISFYEEWEQDFWKISKAERKFCLQNGKNLYAPPKELRMAVCGFSEFWEKIKSFLDYNHICKQQQQSFFSLLNGADIFEIGGYCARDFEYLAVKGDTLLLISCGFWD